MLLSYSLSREAGTPLYEQLYSAIKADILCGRLAGGERLPSKRALSGHLNISKITVERTLTELVKTGYLRKVGAGRATAYVKAEDME